MAQPPIAAAELGKALEGAPPCEGPIAPEHAASCLSRVTFAWVNALIARGKRRPLEQTDLPQLPPEAQSATATAALLHEWELELERVRAAGAAGAGSKTAALPSLALAIYRRYRVRHALAGLLRLSSELLGFVGPLLLHAIVETVQEAEEAGAAKAAGALGAPRNGSPTRRMAWLAVALLAASVAQFLCLNNYVHAVIHIGLRVRVALVGAIFRKSLALSPSTLRRSTTGQITTLMSTDAERLREAIHMSHHLWVTPVIITVCMALLWMYIGAAAAGGVAVMVLMLAVQRPIAARVKALRRAAMVRTDERLVLTHEVLAGIHVVKANAWEAPLAARIAAARDAELALLRSIAVTNAANMVVTFGTPVLVALASFGLHTVTSPDEGLTPADAFTAIALFNVLRNPLRMLPKIVPAMMDAVVAHERIRDFLLLPCTLRSTVELEEEEEEEEERGEQQQQKQQRSEKGHIAIRVDGCSFTWEEEEEEEEEEQEQEQEGEDGGGTAKAARGLALSRVQLRVPRGELWALVGHVGSGKSTLLQGLIGEVRQVPDGAAAAASRRHRARPAVGVRGSVAYVSQMPYILSASIRANILFGLPLEAGKYAEALHAAALETDLLGFADGDLTEVGERGITLSGGQQQRIALARACYRDADVYLLDCVMSAVDAETGAAIFERCLGSEAAMLRRGGKTVLLATHQLHGLARVDCVAVLGPAAPGGGGGGGGGGDGGGGVGGGSTIVECGPHDELLAAGGVLARMVNGEEEGGVQLVEEVVVGEEDAEEGGEEEKEEGGGAEEKDEGAAGAAGGTVAAHSAAGERVRLPVMAQPPRAARQPAAPPAAAPPKKSGGGSSSSSKVGKRLMTVEERETGTVKRQVWTTYLAACGRSYGIAILALLLANQPVRVGCDWWLSQWTKPAAEGGGDDRFVPGRFRGSSRDRTSWFLGVYAALCLATVALVGVRAYLVASAALRSARALHASLLGAVLRLPMAFFDTTPLGRTLARFGYDTERIDVALPQTTQQFLEFTFTLLGISGVIWATSPWFLLPSLPIGAAYWSLQATYRASSRELKRLDSVSRSPIYAGFSEALGGLTTIRAFGGAAARFTAQSDRATTVNAVAYMGSMVANRWLGVRLEAIGAAVVFMVALFVALSWETVGAGQAGLALSYALLTTKTLNWSVRMGTELEVQMNCVERVRHYCSLAPEAPLAAAAADGALPAGWPRGEVRFEALSMRYRPDLPFALRGAELSVAAGEKIGVCGRTGSGKSTMVHALFRFSEAAAGRLLIDGVDVATLGLARLRSSIAIITQEPTLFVGSVRSNLDPFGAHGDAELWAALEKAQLRAAVQRRGGGGGAGGGLDSVVSEGGSNFSVGERQLLCLARVMLQGCRVLVLDECTANVDAETDTTIQSMIRRQFGGITVFTIAHRLNTVIDSDRIVVIDGGKIAEVGSPKELLEREAGLFRALVREAEQQ